MTFLNGLLAFGAAAFTIPLLIHLLHRNRVVTVDWGAMHLLQFSRQSPGIHSSFIRHSIGIHPAFTRHSPSIHPHSLAFVGIHRPK